MHFLCFVCSSIKILLLVIFCFHPKLCHPVHHPFQPLSDCSSVRSAIVGTCSSTRFTTVSSCTPTRFTTVSPCSSTRSTTVLSSYPVHQCPPPLFHPVRHLPHHHLHPIIISYSQYIPHSFQWTTKSTVIFIQIYIICDSRPIKGANRFINCLAVIWHFWARRIILGRNKQRRDLVTFSVTACTFLESTTNIKQPWFTSVVVNSWP